MKRTVASFFIFAAVCALLCAGCSPTEKDLKSSYDRIFSDYQKELKKDPENPGLKLRFARLCYSFNDYEQVILALEGEADLSARVMLAKAYSRMHEYTRALELFEAMGEELKDPEGLYLYGRVLEEKNLYPQAVKVYGKVKGEFSDKAGRKIAAIQATVEREIPAEVSGLSRDAADFISRVSEEAAVLLSVDETMEVFPDHTSVSTIHVIEKVLKERGKEIAEVELGYDSTYERVDLEYARTITEQGLIIYAGKENIRDVTKYLNFPLYSNAKAHIISMPSVDAGSIIEYKVRIYSSKLINDKDISVLYRLREKFPVFKARFNLIVPESMKLKVTKFNESFSPDTVLDPVYSSKDGKGEYLWEFREVLPIIPEYDMPPLSLVNPAVLMSSFGSWQEIYAWWKELYKDKLEVTGEMEAVLKGLIAQADNEYERAKKIYEYVARNIRYVAVEYGESGHEPHKAKDVFLNRYGDCKDQAILLTALLKKAGLEAAPVLIPTRDAYAVKEDFPSVNFNHAIAAVRVDQQVIFMDPTSETTVFTDLPAGDQGRTVLVFFDEGYKIMTTPELATSELSVIMEIDLDANEDAQISRLIKSRGGYSSFQRYYLKYSHPSKIRQNVENKMMEISPFSRLLEYKIENVDDFDAVPQLWYRFKAEKFLNPSQNLRVVPPLNQIDLPPSLIAGESRAFPIDFGELSTKRAVITIALPDNLKVKYLPRDVAIDTRWFDFSISYEPGSRALKFSQEFRVKERFVTRAEYAQFRQKMKDVFYLLREEIIFEKTD